MPNYCENYLTVKGLLDDLRAFLRENQGAYNNNADLSFQYVAPEVKGTCSSHYTTWGTKWDACDPVADLDEEANELTYSFDTAWSPPLEWLTAAIQKYPMLEFKLEYEEPGCDFGGIMEGADGEVYNDQDWVLSDYRWTQLMEAGAVDAFIEDLTSTNTDDSTNVDNMSVYEYACKFLSEHYPDLNNYSDTLAYRFCALVEEN